MNIPTNIYDSKGKLINNLHTTTDKFLLIISETNNDYVALENCKFINSNNDIVTTATTQVITLYLTNETNCLFSVNGEKYQVTYIATNKIPEHYNTIISNKNLPTNEEILSCIVDRETHMVLGKLLLEFQTILRHRGTITTVEKFLNFIGFKFIDVFTEYIDSETKDIGLTNNLNSVKTGNYHVFYSYDYENKMEFDADNFPVIQRDDNVVDFVDILCNAIVVAKKYFLIPEQDINFFAVNLITNIGRYQSIASNQTVHSTTDPSYYIKDINTFNIDVFTETLFSKNYIVKDAIEYDSNVVIESHEVKFVPSNNAEINNNIFYVDEEFSDDDPLIPTIRLTPENYNSKFGNIIHLDLLIPKLFLNFELINVDIPLIKIVKNDKELVNGRYQNRIFIDRPGKYKLTIDLFNEHNNRERFFYYFTVNELTTKISFESFSSVELIDGINDNNLDVESSLLSFESSDGKNKPIHSLIDFDNLVDYFDNNISNLSRYSATSFEKYNRYAETKFNSKFKLSEITDMPLKYINNYISMTFYKVIDDNFALDMTNDNLHIFIDNEIYEDFDATIKSRYIIVLGKFGGLDNDAFFENNNMLEYYQDIKLPLNYDFDINTNGTIHKYESLYTKLTPSTKILKLNDIFYCRPNTDDVVNFTNVTWRIYENISKKLVYEHSGYSLKFRVYDKNIYDVEMEISISGTVNKVYKERCFSSFDVII